MTGLAQKCRSAVQSIAAGLPGRTVRMAIVVGIGGVGMLAATRLMHAEAPKSGNSPAQSTPPAAEAARTKIVTGLVTGADGKPIADAQVWVPLQAINAAEDLTATARCDDAGRFRLAVPEAWLATEISGRQSILWAYAPGHAIGGIDAEAQLFHGKAEPCAVTLPRASDISFVVTSADGKPAVGAQIVPELFQLIGAGIGRVPHELAQQVMATTDADGRARLPALTRAGIFSVAVSFSGHGQQIFQAFMQPTERAERELKLSGGMGRIEGRIVANRVEQTQGMVVRVTSERTPRVRQLDAKGHAIAKVDERGRFVIPEIAQGRLSILVSGDERLPLRPRLPKTGEVELREGEKLQLDIPLEACVQVHGVVRVKGTGRPIAGAWVYVQYGEGDQAEQAIANEDGAYSALVLAGDVTTQVNVLPGDYVQLDSPWDDPELKPHIVPKGAIGFELPPIEVVPTVTMAGKLLDRDGKPLANTQLWVHGLVGDRHVAGNSHFGIATSDDQGAFSLRKLPAGIKFKDFEIRTPNESLKGVVEATDPLLVVRVQP